VGMLCLAVASACLAACTDSASPIKLSPPSGETSGPVTQIPKDPDLVRYVSPDGRDHGPGTRARPWRTLTHAFASVYRGQVLFVHGGTYHEELAHFHLHDGRPTQRITVTNFPGERPVLAGSVSLRRPDYWTISGLNVTWDDKRADPPRFMVKIVGGVGWSWRNSEIWGSKGSANFFVAGYGDVEPARWSLMTNCIHGLVTSGGRRASNLVISNMVDAGPGLISRNLLFAGPNRSQENLAIGSAAGGATRVRVRYNTIYGGELAISIAGHRHGIQITRNLFGGGQSRAMVQFSHGRIHGTVASQNFGVDAQQIFYPDVAKRIGVGNVMTSDSPDFNKVSACDGYRPALAAATPYGRYAL
jgi:hypothetical protein